MRLPPKFVSLSIASSLSSIYLLLLDIESSHHSPIRNVVYQNITRGAQIGLHQRLSFLLPHFSTPGTRLRCTHSLHHFSENTRYNLSKLLPLCGYRVPVVAFSHCQSSQLLFNLALPLLDLLHHLVLSYPCSRVSYVGAFASIARGSLHITATLVSHEFIVNFFRTNLVFATAMISDIGLSPHSLLTMYLLTDLGILNHILAASIISFSARLFNSLL